MFVKWLSFGLLSLTFNILAAEYFVDNQSGKDSNSGTIVTEPLLTLSAVIKKVAPGDKISIKNTGVAYRESFRAIRISGEPGKVITVVGNGAIISGFDVIGVEKIENNKDGQYSYSFGKPLPSNCVPLLRVSGEYVQRISGQTPASGQYCWIDNQILKFKIDDKKKLKNIEISVRESGLQFFRASYFQVSNLLVEGFYNDGVNIHDNCQGLQFRDIESRFNGDDGFSAHEDASAIVWNSYFHNNEYGIHDICASQTYFYGVKITDNQHGVNFMGGYHMLVDCKLKNNRQYQLRLERGQPSGGVYGKDRTGPLYQGIAYLRNVDIEGKSNGITVISGAQALIMNCAVSGGEYAVYLSNKALCELRESVVNGATKADIFMANSRLIQDDNKYYPGNFIVNNKTYNPEQWDEFVEILGAGATKSLISK